MVLEALIDGNPVPDVYINWFDSKELLHPASYNQTVYQYTISNVQLNLSTSYTFSVVPNHDGKPIFATMFLTVLGMHLSFPSRYYLLDRRCLIPNQ